MFLLSSAPACALTLILCKLLGALWFYHVVLRQPRGSAVAAVAAAPMLCLNLVLPFFWDHRVCPVLLVAHGVAVMGWVANSKVGKQQGTFVWAAKAGLPALASVMCRCRPAVHSTRLAKRTPALS